ncbi:2-hydroxyhepta-2,4-diene-1,7-dioate isomerase [Streptomyces sp. NRRL F-5122]|uniref:fumarylacetoacetate hydrolase family protein n=1 Tax=Streptomyces sp. NRRL F-5122 TaxID=1609098 RepID=UPI000740DBFB|nr:fumarylacetoacetate hydrolase family protein [Streptomyces sp. NRRL F-5122]KUJ34659.1 2-hydroxyhepta-2,4-diene-1,7-dioate isomerase [Streptomyces sp. NRRL F-5122]
MRLARHGTAGAERPLISGADGSWHDLRPLVADLTPDTLPTVLAGVDLDALPVVESPGRFGAPLTGIGKIVCVGLNYRQHAAETGAAVPEEPIVFLKTPDTVVGPDDEVLIPRRSQKTDYEVELAVVIGREARYLPDEAAAAACDVSEREFQLERGGQWDKGKNCETFNPLGPWLLTADEVPDPQALGLRLSVNGEPRQDGNTSDMIFGVHHLIWYLSHFMVLRPGDVINTGTPAGVTLGRPGLPYLRAGDVVDLEIDGLGRQRQTFGQA